MLRKGTRLLFGEAILWGFAWLEPSGVAFGRSCGLQAHSFLGLKHVNQQPYTLNIPHPRLD